MFVHRKKHRSGHVSIIVMDKSSGKLREVKNFGVAKSDSEADELYFEAKQWIRRYGGQLEMDFIDDEVKLREQEETTRVLSNIDSLLINGHRLILDQVYDSIGFNEIKLNNMRKILILSLGFALSLGAQAKDYHRTADTTTVVCRLSADGMMSRWACLVTVCPPAKVCPVQKSSH